MTFTEVEYSKLNSRQQELYNFHKIAARLVDFGYNSIRLSDDWEGADFLACHIDGATVLRVQLKGRMVLEKKYLGKGLHVEFRNGEETYIYPHDHLLEEVRRLGVMNEDSENWRLHGFRYWPRVPEWGREFLHDYKL